MTRRRIWAAVMFLVALGIAWLDAMLLTSRTYQFGDPPFEKLISSCRLAPRSAGVARLYRGNGGATTAFWYSVTLQRPRSLVEHQFFYSYRAPVISAMHCDADGQIALVGGDSVRRYSLAEAESHLAYVFAYQDGVRVLPDTSKRPAPPAEGAPASGWEALGFAAILAWGAWRVWRPGAAGAV
jgi:hypothetical protein